MTTTALSSAAIEALASIDTVGYTVLGTMEPELTERLAEAADTMAARWGEGLPGGQLHLLSCLERHVGLTDIVDWPPLLDVLIGGLSPNIYINHSHIDVHPPHPPTPGRRWHRDGGVQGRDMRKMPCDQPRLALKVGVFLTDVSGPDDGALEIVPASHLDLETRPTATDPADGVAVTVPAGTVVVFDARVWHRRRDNLGSSTRKAMYINYTYRWVTSRECRFDDVPEWLQLSPVRRQLLGEASWDPFYPVAGELPLEQLAR